MPNTELSERLLQQSTGVICDLQYRGESYVLALPEEDNKKTNIVFAHRDIHNDPIATSRLNECSYGTISGAQKNGEPCEQTLIREAEKEYGLMLSPYQIQEASFDLPTYVLQLREKHIRALFFLTWYIVSLTDKQFSNLCDRGKIRKRSEVPAERLRPELRSLYEGVYA